MAVITDSLVHVFVFHIHLFWWGQYQCLRCQQPSSIQITAGKRNSVYHQWSSTSYQNSFTELDVDYMGYFDEEDEDF